MEFMNTVTPENFKSDLQYYRSEFDQILYNYLKETESNLKKIKDAITILEGKVNSIENNTFNSSCDINLLKKDVNELKENIEIVGITKTFNKIKNYKENDSK